jgi:hypothetical protein
MDQTRFDSLAKRFADAGSRRGFLRGLARSGAALAAARLGFATQSADARQCRDYGCYCNAGEYLSCRRGLVCCEYAPGGYPGGPGQCLAEDECYGPQCISSGGPCAPYCGWGASCGDCCSGYCNDFGVCDTPRCTGPGCACATGTYLPCDPGLTCCPQQPGLPGGPGVCAPEGSC